MKEKYKRVRTRFGPETRFEVTPAAPAPFRAVQETELERLKKRLLQERLTASAGVEFNMNIHLRRAANEAASLSWVSGVPLLVFPSLFEEIAQTALSRARLQENIRERSRELLAA